MKLPRRAGLRPVGSPPPQRRSQHDALGAYYDETWRDYRMLWLTDRTLAVHFGYTDATTHGHADELLNMNRVLARYACVAPGDRVLDAGCGVGGSSLWLAQACGASVIGITPVASQVARAHRFSSGSPARQRVAFVRADYCWTPWADASFDVVWALESLCHAPLKAAFYREAARLLRPGGRLVIAEYMRCARPLGAGGEQLLHRWLDGWAIPDLDTPAEHMHHARAAELIDMRVDNVVAHTEPSLRRLYRMRCRLYPLAAVARVLGLRSAVQHGNVLGAIHQYRALQRGLWFYGICSARKPSVRCAAVPTRGPPHQHSLDHHLSPQSRLRSAQCCKHAQCLRQRLPLPSAAAP